MDTQPAIRHNLPTQPTSFIGREEEIAECVSLLNQSACRVLTLVGPGGMGKTRLAIEVAACVRESYADGVFFVSLQPLTKPGNMFAAIAAAIGHQFHADDRDPRQQLLHYLRNKTMLLLLDNVEHLLEEVDLVTDLLANASGVTLLVTSREALNLREEWLRQVSGLPVPPDDHGEPAETCSAVRLFVERTRQVSQNFSLANEISNVVHICQLVGGMPLAIELASTWAKILSCEEIAGEIERGVAFLTSPLRNVPKRHRSLSAVFDGSWKLLSDKERKVFRHLSMFRGGFTRHAARAVTGADLWTLQSLVDKSLIRWNPSIERYDIHPLLHQYAAERLEESGEAEIAGAAHLHYFAGMIEAHQASLRDNRQLEALDSIEADFDNVRAAWTWALRYRHAEVIDQMAGGIALFARMRSREHEGRELFEEAIRQLIVGPDAIPQRLLAKLRARQAFLLASMHHPEEAEALLWESLEIARKHGDRYEEAFCLQELSWAKAGQERLAEALQLAGESKVLFAAAGKTWELASVNLMISFVTAGLGDLEGGHQYALQSYQLFHELGNVGGMALALIDLGFAASARGDLEAADRYQRQALALRREIGDLDGLAWSLSAVATCAQLQGEFEEAEQLARESLALARNIDSPEPAAGALVVLSAMASVRGDADEAFRLAEESFRSAQTGGNWYVISHAAQQLGWALCGIGAHDAAVEPLSTALVKWLAMSNRPSALACVACAVSVLAHRRHTHRAVELLAMVSHHPIQIKWLDEHPLLAGVNQDLQDELGTDVYRAAWERGKSLSLETSAQELLAELHPISHSETALPEHVIAANQQLSEPLTERELETLHLVSLGLTNQEIAEHLVLSVNTVKTHLKNLYAKLGVTNRVQATQQGQALGLMAIPSRLVTGR